MMNGGAAVAHISYARQVDPFDLVVFDNDNVSAAHLRFVDVDRAI
jgi:hypothetical protein